MVSEEVTAVLVNVMVSKAENIWINLSVVVQACMKAKDSL